MTASALIEFFSTFTRLPVMAEDVRDQLVEMGVQDEILLRPMDVPPDDLLGMFVRCRRRRGVYAQEVSNRSIILYNCNIDPDMQNFVCVKELMHVFDDRIKAQTNNAADLTALIDDLFADHLASPFNPSLGGIIDEMAVALALAVLFPHDIRDDFIAAHASHRMSHEDIAKLAGLPVSVIPSLLAKKWESTRELLLAIK